MRQIILTATIINLLVIVLSGSSCTRDCCDECCRRKDYRELWDRHDCMNWHRDVILGREFLDPRDFRPDSIYGDPHGWRDRDCGRFYDDPCRYHDGGRRWKSYRRHGHLRYNDEDALSERHLPPPAPDREYDE
ncbi:MAG TPA: hypothetical protein PKN50_13680 [Spirochaetota bacterium]|nr:hypothetical protein [Spirochaetota bacterium]HPV39835.1 hypothetical protein [Spirochaetota bacterium]